MPAPVRPGQVVTVFRSRLRPDAGEDYPMLATAMLERARATGALVDFKTFTAPDGERVSIVTFDSPESHAAWRDDPQHRDAQRAGREHFYSEYSITVGVVSHAAAFSAGTTDGPGPVRSAGGEGTWTGSTT
jgi:heme-degrading monooxygenase HmoA